MKIILAALALFLIGCGTKPATSDAEKEAATPVEVATAVREPVERVVSAQAILYPVNQSALTPKLSAPIARILVNRGDHVRKGQLLAELEDRDLVAAANEGKALYAQAQAQYATTTEAQLPDDLTKARTDRSSAQQLAGCREESVREPHRAGQRGRARAESRRTTPGSRWCRRRASTTPPHGIWKVCRM